MKKFLKIFVINLFIIIFLFFCIEFLSYLITNDYKVIKDDFIFRYINKNYYDSYNFRETSKSDNHKKASVVLVGCSYPYGSGLNDDETFSAILSKNTQRTVYNFGLEAAGLQEFLHILRNKEFIDNLVDDKKNIQYVIYTYIPDHQRRLYINFRPNVPNFKYENGHFVYKKSINFFNKLYITLCIKNFLFSKIYSKNAFNKAALYINEINEEVKSQFSYGDKPSKFIVLIYSECGNEDWNKLNRDIEVIKLTDIVTEDLSVPAIPCDNKSEYYLSNCHPNAKAWQVIVNGLEKKLGL